MEALMASTSQPVSLPPALDPPTTDEALTETPATDQAGGDTPVTDQAGSDTPAPDQTGGEPGTGQTSGGKIVSDPFYPYYPGNPFAEALQVTFEDLLTGVTHPVTIGNVYDGYQGFNWDIANTTLPNPNLTAFSRQDAIGTEGEPFQAGIIGEVAVADVSTTGFGSVAIYRSDGSDFVWQSLWATATAPQPVYPIPYLEQASVPPTQEYLYVAGYRDGFLVNDVSVQVNNQYPTQVLADWKEPIDYLQISHSGGPMVFDNFDFLV
jgi:hypothetical protein